MPLVLVVIMDKLGQEGMLVKIVVGILPVLLMELLKTSIGCASTTTPSTAARYVGTRYT
jgi:hypothetical protein